MDAKFTLGPWRVEQEPEWPFHIYIISSDGEVVGCERRHAYSTSHKSIDDVMQAKGFKGNQEECIAANARQLANETLKAAAPELLAELSKRVGNAEEAAFDGWFQDTTPSGDVTSVKRQWEESRDYRAFSEQWRSALDVIAKATGE